MVFIRIDIRVPLKVREALEKASNELGMSQSEIIAEALIDWLDSVGYLEGE